MVSYLEQMLAFLRPAFSRHAAFVWFVVAWMGVATRTDAYGVSSVVRALGLAPGAYLLLLHFFHSTAWDAEGLMERWWRWLGGQNVAWGLNGRLVFTGDHTKTPKDARKMPAVTTLHQDSETASKPSFFRGHHWGCIALVTRAKNRFFSTPLWAAVHEGLAALGGPPEDELPKTVRTVAMAQRAARVMGQHAYLVLDAYFSVGPVFLAAAALLGEDGPLIHILTRAKKNIVAYLPAPPKDPHTRGKQARYGEKLKLYDRFALWADRFTPACTSVYGQSATVGYLTMDLLWKPIKGYLRFFWFQTPRGQLVLMTSDLTLQPLDALEAYAHRASIETLFNTFKNVLGGMAYHFWSKYLERASRRPKKNQSARQKSSNLPATLQTLAAIEKHVNLHLLVLGGLQLLAMRFAQEVTEAAHCWMRTLPKDIPSEFTVKTALFNLLRNNNDGFAQSTIMRLIRVKQQIPNPMEEKERVA
jgi:hypothetical protein